PRATHGPRRSPRRCSAGSPPSPGPFPSCFPRLPTRGSRTTSFRWSSPIRCGPRVRWTRCAQGSRTSSCSATSHRGLPSTTGAIAPGWRAAMTCRSRPSSSSTCGIPRSRRGSVSCSPRRSRRRPARGTTADAPGLLMRPHRLRVTAFGAFGGTVEVCFDDLAASGLFLLHGETGAGKTTLLDAIGFALYGRVPGERGKARRLRSDHAPAEVPTEVLLEATIGGRRLRITRKPEQARPKRRGDGFTTEQARVLVEERSG